MALGDQLGKLIVGTQVDLGGLVSGLSKAEAALRAAQRNMSTDTNRWSTDVQRATAEVENAWAKVARAQGDRAKAISADLAQIRNGFEQLGTLGAKVLNDLDTKFPAFRRTVAGLKTEWRDAVTDMRISWRFAEEAISKGLSRVQGLFAPVGRAAGGLGSAFGSLRILAERELGRIGTLVSPIGRAFSDMRSIVDREIGVMIGRLAIFGVAMRAARDALAPWGAAFRTTLVGVGGLLGDLAVVAGTRLVGEFGKLGSGIGGLIGRLNPLGAAARGVGNAFSGMFGGAISGAAEALGGTFTSLGTALSRLNVPLLGVSGVFKGLGTALEATPALLLPVIGLFAALAAVLGPLLLTLTAATFILTGFVVGLSGMIATVGIAGGILAGLGAAVVALASATNGWNNADKQMKQAQSALNSATKAHQSAVESLQRSQASANKTHQATALQVFDLSVAQRHAATTAEALRQAQIQTPPVLRTVAAATNSHQSALDSLTRAQLTVNATTKPSASQLLGLSIAQSHAASTAQQLSQAQAAVAAAALNQQNPLETMKHQWEAVAKTWGEQVTPMAGQILFWLGSMAPQVQDLGTDLFNWLGPRMSKFIENLGIAFDTLFKTLRPFGKELGEWIDKVLNRSPAFQYFFGLFAKFGEKTIMGLLNNLLALSDWFMAHWPAMGPVVAQIFSAIGSAVQWLAHWIGVVIVWFITHWPQILKWTSELWDRFSSVVAVLGPLIGWIWKTIMGLLAVKETLPGLRDLAFIAGVVVVAALGLVIIGIGLLVLGWLALAITVELAWQKMQEVWKGAPGWFGNIFAQIGGVFSNFGSMVHDALNNVITVIDNFLNAVNSSPLGSIGVHIGLVPHIGGGGGNLGSGRFAKGGIVPGGQGGGDTFSAMLTPGEVVLNTSAVRGLGGPEAANRLNHGMGGMNPGEWGGQCVVFLENLLGVHWPVAMASQLCGATTNFAPVPGEVAVFGGGPFGHVALVTGVDGSSFSVLDSNWVGPETIGVHTMNTGMYGYCGAFPPVGAHIPAGLGALGALFDPGNLVKGLIKNVSLGGVAPWLQPATMNIIQKAGGGIVQMAKDKLGSIGSWVGHDVLHLDKGGVIPPGLSTVYNGLGGPEALVSLGRTDAHGMGGRGPGGGTTYVFNTVGKLDPEMVRESQRIADWHNRTGGL